MDIVFKTDAVEGLLAAVEKLAEVQEAYPDDKRIQEVVDGIVNAIGVSDPGA